MSTNASGDFSGWFHGSRSTYNAGCHCDACRDATNRYARERTEAARPVIVARPEPWMADAACADNPIETFFPNMHEDAHAAYAAARLICGQCPVAEQCLDYAIAHNERHGMWGGLTPKQRHNARRLRRAGGAA